MVPLINTVLFLLGVYWPFMTLALVVGLITGWISLDRNPGEGTK